MSGRRHMLGSVVAMLLAGLLLIAGCGPAQGVNLGADVAKADTNEVMVGTIDNGGKVELARGQILVVTLESNPTTGFSWQVVSGEGSVLQQIGEAEFTAQSDLMGAAGVETFRFEATAGGQATLELAYQRPWEKDVDPLQTFSVEVTVQ